MVIDKTQKESTYVKIIIFLVGLLLGLGGMYATAVTDVRENRVRIEVMATAVQNNNLTIQATITLVRDVVNQNNVLINKIISDKRP